MAEENEGDVVPSRGPDVSVVIPARNAASTLGRQLAALSRQVTDRDFEVVVADNGSTDSTTSVVASFEALLPRLRLVDASTRTGANSARNCGTLNAQGAFVLLCDADDEVDPGWVEAMSRGLESADAVGGRIDREKLNQGITETGLRIAGISGITHAHSFLPFPIGANAGYRKAVWEALGGFDEAFVRGGTETEFFWRLQLAGYSLRDVPDALVYYRMRADVRSSVRQMYVWGRQSPMLYRKFRPYGMKYEAWKSARYWLWALGLLRKAPRSAPDRIEFARHAAYCWGRVVGSVKYRVLFL